jgi:hypothetical protein
MIGGPYVYGSMKLYREGEGALLVCWGIGGKRGEVERVVGSDEEKEGFTSWNGYALALLIWIEVY